MHNEFVSETNARALNNADISKAGDNAAKMLHESAAVNSAGEANNLKNTMESSKSTADSHLPALHIEGADSKSSGGGASASDKQGGGSASANPGHSGDGGDKPGGGHGEDKHGGDASGKAGQSHPSEHDDNGSK